MGMKAQIVGLALLSALVGCGGGSPASAPATVTVTHAPPTTTGPVTFSASGYIDVNGTSFYPAGGGDKVCTSDTGYDDVQTGAQVTVSSSKGDVVAVGRLGDGVKHGILTCRFRFTVDAIPEGFPLYSVEVSHRGALTYSEDEMKAGLAFNLG